MPRWRPLLFFLLWVVALSGCTRKTQAPRPVALKSQSIDAYVVLPSIDKALEDFAAFLKAVSAPPMTPKEIKAQLGMLVGDPELSGFDLKKPVLLTAAAQAGSDPFPSFALYLPVRDAAPYLQVLAGFGMQTHLWEDLLMVAPTPEALQVAQEQKSDYQAIAQATIPSAVRFYCRLAPLMKKYGPILEEGIDEFLAMAIEKASQETQEVSGEFLTKFQPILELEVRGLLALLKQCQEVQWDLNLNASGIDLNSLVVANPGSRLASFFARSSTLSAPHSGLLEPGGIFNMTYAFDMENFAQLILEILDDLDEKIPQAESLRRQIQPILTDLIDGWPSAGAASLSSVAETPLLFHALFEVKDSEMYLQAMERSMSLMDPGTFLHGLYQSMGIHQTSKFQRDVRKHSGVSIHRFETTTEFSETDLKEMMESEWLQSLSSFELAMLEKRALLSSDPRDLDRLIDAARSGGLGGSRKLQAQKRLGSGGQIYADYDFVELLRKTQGLFPEDERLPATIDLKAAPPLLFAVTFARDRAYIQNHVPTGLLTAFTQLAPK